MKHKKPKCSYSDHRTQLGKVWHFLAHEDTWLSFVVDAILIVVIGRFLVYPGVGLMMGTDFPVVAVISGSMDHHDMEFNSWWESNREAYNNWNISKAEFEQFYLKNGFKKGDVLVIKGKPFEEYKSGDIIVYTVAGRADPIIHRIVQKQATISTKGDANFGQLGFEKAITESQVEGRAVLLIPTL